MSTNIDFERWVLSEPACVAYWPLTSDGTDLKGANTMLLTDVVFEDGAAYFNGTSSLGISTAVLDLSGTDKATIIANIKFKTWNTGIYDAVVINHGLVATEAGLMVGIGGGSGATGDEFIQMGGSSGVGTYNLGNHLIRTEMLGNKIFTALTHDRALDNPEHKEYFNGSFRNYTATTFNVNLAGNFGSNKVYLAKANIFTEYFDGYISELAIFSRILTGPEIQYLYNKLNQSDMFFAGKRRRSLWFLGGK